MSLRLRRPERGADPRICAGDPDGYEVQPRLWLAQAQFVRAATSLRNWVRQAEIDGGTRAGRTSEERERIKLLERENKELRRANEILKSAAVFFGAELDRRSPR